jgi:hypothetical protein
LKNKNCGIYKVEVTLSQSRLLMGRQVKQRRSRQNRKNPISPINDALSKSAMLKVPDPGTNHVDWKDNDGLSRLLITIRGCLTYLMH